MSRYLEGKVAIVTGSTSGMGIGMAEALAGAGAKVVLNGFGEADEIEALRARIVEEAGVEVAYDPADLMEPEEVVGLVERTEARWGSVDVLCNNAGIQHVALTEHFPAERWDAQIAILLSAPFHAIRAALPGMKARGWGRIVNTSSTSGLRGSAKKPAYCAAKHGILGLTKVALEITETGEDVPEELGRVTGKKNVNHRDLGEFDFSAAPPHSLSAVVSMRRRTGWQLRGPRGTQALPLGSPSESEGPGVPC